MDLWASVSFLNWLCNSNEVFLRLPGNRKIKEAQAATLSIPAEHGNVPHGKGGIMFLAVC